MVGRGKGHSIDRKRMLAAWSSERATRAGEGLE